VGKTRVAIRVASGVRRPFADGVRFVDLSVLQPGDSVSDAVLVALHARPSAHEEPRDAVVRALRSLRVLIVLDSCEHVIREVRALVAAVLAGCAGVHVLATSREALNLEGEHHLAVDPLDVPEAGTLDEVRRSPAAALFVARARTIDPRFALDAPQAEAIATLCRRLGGMPLAIELAAARLDVDSLEELTAVRSTEGLLQRLAGALPAATRLGSVRGSLQWSFDLLTDDERSMFTTLGIFAGSFTRQMALELCGVPDSPEHDAVFIRLVRCSMVSRDLAEPSRFRLLEPAREFCRSLHTDVEWQALQDRHSRVMEERARRFGPLMRTAKEAEACRTLRAEFADHRRAMHWLLERGDHERAAALLVPLLDFYLLQVRSEGHEWARALTPALPEDHPLASEVAGAAAVGAWYAGDLDGALELGERAVASGERTGGPTTWARMALVDSLAYTGRLQDLGDHFRAFVHECRASPEPWWQIGGLAYESIAAFVLGRLDRAVDKAESALERARRLGNPDCFAWTLSCLGRALSVTDPDAGCEALEQAMAVQRGIESRWNGALTLLDWVAVKRRLGDHASTGVGVLELLDLLAVSGNRSQLSQVLREAAYALWAGGEPEAAATAMLARPGLPEMPHSLLEPESDEELMAALREAVGSRWSRLEVRALGLSEDDLITRCRSSLEGALRDLGPRAPEVVLDRRRDLVVVYTDLVASTSLNVAVGDEAFLGLLREHNRIVRRRLTRFGGTEFTYTGDGVGAWFASADAAVQFALGLQADLDDANTSHALSPLRVRIGLARGDALADQGNLFGQTIVRSVRVCATAEAGQVLVTGDIADALDGSVARVISIGPHHLKGFAGDHELFEVREPRATVRVS
jgi:predicted ATPase/class 3 adenylate cyclase